MMDLKEIIKWFIPCFHILLKLKLSKKWILVCLFLFTNLVASSKLNSDILLSDTIGKNVGNTKNINVSLVKYTENEILNQSEVVSREKSQAENIGTFDDTSVAVGRTFGRPFKKMMAGLMPVIFQVGAASTWAVVAALVGVKTLLISVFILKILMIAGAAKLGALFASKSHHAHGWEPPHQKEIHLHIHNGGGHEHHEEHIPISSWSRESYSEKPGFAYEPYRAGPQTISTPFGNYVKIDSSPNTHTT